MENELSALLQHPPSPIQLLAVAELGIRLLVKRDDLLHPEVSGNKWRKLKHNLLEAKRLGKTKLVTFGGAYSNHLAATAAAGKLFGFSTVGVVRGEPCGKLNPTLQYVEWCGMEVFYESRANFKNKSHTHIIEALGFETKNCYVMPQGGANCLALQGCQEIVRETEAQLGSLPDYLVVPCGTGATLAGITSGLNGRSKAIGIAVLKGGFLTGEVSMLLENCTNGLTPTNWEVREGFHFGGYAKFNPSLIGFVNGFKQRFGITLDPIYTGKAMFAVFELAESGFFEKNSTVLFVHTGGLQGIAGFNEAHPRFVIE